MKKSFITLATALIMLVSVPLAGQSKKTIREKGITSQTVLEYFLGEGMKEPVVELEEKYNRQGEVIEVKEFNKRGEVRKWERYTYDGEGRLVDEIFLDENGRIERKETNVYENGLRVEKRFYDSRDRLFKRKEYVYEYRR